MKIGTKLTIGFLAFTLVVVVVGTISYVNLKNIQQSIESDLEVSISELSLDNKLNNLALSIRFLDEILTQSARNYALTGERKWKIRYYEFAPELDVVIDEALLNSNNYYMNNFKNIKQSNLKLVNLEKNAINLVDQGRKTEAIKILESNEYKKQKLIFTNNLNSYLSEEGGQKENFLENSVVLLRLSQERTKNIIKNNITLTTFLIIFLIILSIYIGIKFTRDIKHRIENFTNVARAVEKGNFNSKVNITTKDELTSLAISFNKMISALSRLDNEHKQLDKAKSDFLSITSHELRSPMTPAQAQIQMLLRGHFGKLSKEQKSSLIIVLRNLKRLDTIIGDLLEISKVEAAKIKFNFVKTNLKEPINALVKEMKDFMPEKNIKIITKFGKLPIFEVDPDRVMQVLRNLLNNAIKFSEKNDKVIVRASLNKSSNMILFKVKDFGIGVSPIAQTRIFEPFYQAEQTIYRKYQGTGLGLAICKGIINSQNGNIWLESTPNKGTTFYFTVPLKPVKEIKSIKLMFSDNDNKINKLVSIFIEYLGPMGESEFKRLNNDLSLNNMLAKITEYKKEGIINNFQEVSFKKSIKNILTIKKTLIKKEKKIKGKLKNG